MAQDDRHIEILAGLHNAQGAIAFHLELYGNDLAKQEGYREHTGLDAVRFYLMNKHGWLPRDVRTMSIEDIDFATSEMRKDWKAPKAARGVYPGM